MGVDVVLKARTDVPLTEPEFSAMKAALYERFPGEVFESWRWPDLEFDPYEPVQTVELNTGWRYYGPGYERGDWPAIREVGDWFATVIGGRGEVRYGGDTADEWDALTPWPEVRRENDAHWERYGNEPYAAAFRRQW